MIVTLAEITPIGICIATQELFDAKRFQANFCDNILLRNKDESVEDILISIKRELNSSSTLKKFLDGYKVVIISNIDKIIGFVVSRFAKTELKLAEGVVAEAKSLIDKITLANSFDDIARLEPIFRSKITFPVYEMFSKDIKNRKPM